MAYAARALAESRGQAFGALDAPAGGVRACVSTNSHHARSETPRARRCRARRGM
jgi:hypothetical protein